MSDVLVLVRDRRGRARIVEALRGSARSVLCDRASDVRTALDACIAARRRVGAIILDSSDADGTPTAPLVAQLRERAPAVPVLALCAASPEASPAILAAARAGASGILLQGHDDVGAALRSAISSAADDCAARHVMRELDAFVPAALRGLVEYCVQHGRSPLSVAGVARALGVHRKTLVNRLATARLPEPRVVITWCRLSLVAVALEDPTYSVERVALDFGFPSANALRNLCKRHTGLRATEVRLHGGLACVLSLFKRELRRAPEARLAALQSRGAVADD